MGAYCKQIIATIYIYNLLVIKTSPELTYGDVNSTFEEALTTSKIKIKNEYTRSREVLINR